MTPGDTKHQVDLPTTKALNKEQVHQKSPSGPQRQSPHHINAETASLEYSLSSKRETELNLDVNLHLKIPRNEYDPESEWLRGRAYLNTVYRFSYGITKKRKQIQNMENTPNLPSLYDDKLHTYIQENHPLLNNRVHIPWYRRYTETLPESELTTHQPYREIQTRDEDIALQFVHGTHECMHDNVYKFHRKLSLQECKNVREAAMARYMRVKKRELLKAGQLLDQGPGRINKELDFTQAFGFSAQKKAIVQPVTDYLQKLQRRRDRRLLMSLRPLKNDSKWKNFYVDKSMEQFQKMIVTRKRQQARNRIKRVFSLVLCVHRFIKCVAMIAGDTQTLLKDLTQQPKTPFYQLKGRDGRKQELTLFKVEKYRNVRQITIPFNIQLILSKPWYCRSNKEIETALNFLEKMRSFNAFPKAFQHTLAKCAWYIEIPTQKVIIRQCQEAVNFYLLLDGQVRIDQLRGSPCEGERSHFKTLMTVYSQEMFGDECITAPFSERKYTATSEDKCAMLDFNLHDYNGMIQTPNLNEEAPDHIRFLCKLRIMDNFPKMKLAQDQDTNISFFYFRENTLICKSVRDSPFIFVVRNGMCSLYKELKAKLGRRMAVCNEPRNSTFSVYMESFNKEEEQRSSGSTGIEDKAKFIQDLKALMTKKSKDTFEKAKDAHDTSKAGLQGISKDVQEKVIQVTKSMSAVQLGEFNLDTTYKNEEKDTIDQKSRSSGGLTKQNSSAVRWTEPESETEVARTGDPLSRVSKALLRRWSSQSGVSRKKSKIVGTNIEFKPDTVLNMANKSFTKSENLNNSALPGTARSVLRTVIPNKNKKIPPLPKNAGSPSSERATFEPPERRGMQGIPPSKTFKKTPGAPPVKNSSTQRTTKNEEQPTQRRPATFTESSTSTKSSVGRNGKTTRMASMKSLDRYSQWYQSAILTVTDVAGVEWLDYNDGNYTEPKEDYSLVSHGATVIMIKKEFMLKYLKKVW